MVIKKVKMKILKTGYKEKLGNGKSALTILDDVDQPSVVVN